MTIQGGRGVLIGFARRIRQDAGVYQVRDNGKGGRDHLGRFVGGDSTSSNSVVEAAEVPARSGSKRAAAGVLEEAPRTTEQR